MQQLQEKSQELKMKINPIKTKVALFNPLRKADFMPEVKLEEDGEPLEVVEQIKLLGQIIRTDLRTIDNTKAMCSKAYQRLWMVRRLKNLGGSTGDLLDVLRQQVLSVLELAVPYWAPLITKHESHMIERCLKTGL